MVDPQAAPLIEVVGGISPSHTRKAGRPIALVILIQWRARAFNFTENGPDSRLTRILGISRALHIPREWVAELKLRYLRPHSLFESRN